MGLPIIETVTLSHISAGNVATPGIEPDANDNNNNTAENEENTRLKEHINTESEAGIHNHKAAGNYNHLAREPFT